ncbi:hypothetical protein D3C86_1441800 [compost metagenome]
MYWALFVEAYQAVGILRQAFQSVGNVRYRVRVVGVGVRIGEACLYAEAVKRSGQIAEQLAIADLETLHDRAFAVVRHRHLEGDLVNLLGRGDQGHERVDVFIEGGERQQRRVGEIPFDSAFQLGGAERLQVGVAAFDGLVAGVGLDALARREVRQGRTGHDTRRREAQNQVVRHIQAGVQRGQDVGVLALKADRHDGRDHDHVLARAVGLGAEHGARGAG